MNKKIILFLVLLVSFSACSKSNNVSRFQNVDKKNYNDIQSSLKNDPNNSLVDQKQNPNDFKKDSSKEKKEYEAPKVEDKISKDELNKKRDEDSKDGIINISDGIFLPLVNDIYINKDEYIGKKVRITGQNVKFEDKDTGEVVYAILREGPGCCYNDSVIGFEYITDDKYPEPQKWYEMVGEVIIDNFGTGKVVKLKLINIKEVKPKTNKLIHFG